jgi:ribosomal subunit interface protein
MTSAPTEHHQDPARPAPATSTTSPVDTVEATPAHTVSPSSGAPGGDPVDVIGHGFTVSAQDRAHVIARLGHVHRYDGGVDRYEVGLFHEPNPHQAKTSNRVEITGTGPGLTVRVHASGPAFHPTFAAALVKLQARLRRHRDRLQAQQQGTGRHDPVVDSTA